MRINLLKRMESSIHSFGLTTAKLLIQIDKAIKKIDNHDDSTENPNIGDIDIDDPRMKDLLIGSKKVKVLLKDIDLIKWREELVRDRVILEDILIETNNIKAHRDQKLIELNKTDGLDEDVWKEWIKYILEGIEKTSEETIILIKKISKLMGKTKVTIRDEEPKIYSKDLLEVLFEHPYTKIDFITNRLGISRQTASNHLEKLVKLGVLAKEKVGKHNFYINISLLEILS